MSEVLSATNLKFLAQGLWTTLYLSFFIIVLSTFFGTILAVMRNGKNPILRWIASIYIEFVRNVPNLLWIFIIFLVFQLKSTAAGITSFTDVTINYFSVCNSHQGYFFPLLCYCLTRIVW